MSGRNFLSLKVLVIKLGTSIMTDAKNQFSHEALHRLILQILTVIKKRGLKVVIVSSGAIGLGMEVLGLKRRPKDLAALQACAAVGQGKLMRLYEEVFAKKGYHTAQVLLTRDEFAEHKLYQNVRRTLTELLGRGVVPIINENDTVATHEIQFGDNDTLAALVAQMIRAEMTILMSDVEGFFLKDGSRVDCIRSENEIEDLKGHLYTRKREHTVGGMSTKLRAAQIMLHSGLSLIIADGRNPEILEKILNGENVGTLFMGSGRLIRSHKSWLAHSARAQGTLTVDAGAGEALVKRGKSLLARGIMQAEGAFKRGDVVRIQDQGGRVIGLGQINYSSEEMAKILGKTTTEIPEVLGYKHKNEVVHHNHWVSLSNSKE